jgi:hypothetical protein
MNTTTTPAQAAIDAVAQMIAARLQSRDPITQAEGYRLLTACPLAEDAVYKILCENR